MSRRTIPTRIRAWRAAVAIGVCIAATYSGAGVRADEPAAGEHLTGDWGGLRTALKDKGHEVAVKYTGEVLSNLSGGMKRGTAYHGQLDVTLETDLESAVGWRNAKTHIRAFQIHSAHGRTAADHAGSIADPSNIAATDATRLYTAWFQQGFGDAASIRIGQLAADDEFFVSDTASGLINGTFGWPGIMAAALPSSGPAYPLATPGIRAELNIAPGLSLLTGVFSGDPAGPGCYRNDPDANPQKCNRHGTTFSLSGGALWITEMQYVRRGNATEAASAYKLGAWYHTGRFADQRYGLDGSGNTVSLADPTAISSLHRDGNWGIYGVVDQTIWRAGGSSVSAFVRGGMAPSDRNFVSWYIDGGIGIKGLLAGRADDTLAVGAAHAHISRHASALDRDMALFGSPLHPIRSGETVLEVSYQISVTPWWTIQPDAQYIIRPDSGAAHPDDPTRRIDNAFIVGVRSTIGF